MSSPMALFRDFFRIQERGSMSPAMQEVLEREEYNGGRVANRFRYIFALFFALLAYLNVRGATGDALANYSALGAYVAVTIVQTLLLRRASRTVMRSLNYVGIVLDFAIILSLLLFYTYDISPDNPGFAIKNSVLWLFLLPLAMTAIQFQTRPLGLALFLFMLIYFSLVAATLLGDTPHTTDWKEYVLGPAIILTDILFTRSSAVAGLGLVLMYVIYRAIRMVRRIGEIEAQKTSLSRYFSPDVVDEITREGDSMVGGRQPVTVLFSDIRDFTAMSEGMDTEELAHFLGEFRERMARAIFAQNGTLDKFIGDAIMATFGTPRPSGIPGEDARHAVDAARGMQSELLRWNEERIAAGQRPVRIGIGLHTGEVFAGNVGSGSRLEYTVIGDAVNTASRIESLCKKLDSVLLISEQVYELANRPADASRMPRVRVKGKAEPLQVYRIGVKLSELTAAS
ncbi:MAG: adenylate/guanylate cyclase domain-containing protein [Spirochaetales bacterium]|nr:adenylate/guanylate cyclase domain-containing protein [Spirochaetales bacterium]MCP5484986.1 adenylate/guanylate cyclase domain-containing protein [Spirochaetales bacterium]